MDFRVHHPSDIRGDHEAVFAIHRQIVVAIENNPSINTVRHSFSLLCLPWEIYTLHPTQRKREIENVLEIFSCDVQHPSDRLEFSADGGHRPRNHHQYDAQQSADSQRVIN
jgi:hypothetical protein